MKILMFGTDRGIFQKGSDVRSRMVEYGALVGELHIVVFAKGELKLSKERIADNVWVYSTNSRTRGGYILDAVRTAKRIVLYANMSTKDTVVTAQDPFEVGLVAWYIARKFRLSLQLQVHTDLFSPYFKSESRHNALRVRLAKFLLLRADGIRVVSEKIKNSIQAVCKKLTVEPVILPIFVNVKSVQYAHFDHTIRKKYAQFESIILMVGRLEKEKNISVALYALSHVLKTHPHTGLVVLGEGSERKKLTDLASELGIDKNVVFVGHTYDTVSYYKSADIFLHTADYEGYGLVFIEAAAAGVPIVSTDVGTTRGLLRNGESALLCPVGDDACLNDRILRILNDKQRGEDLAENAKKAVLAREGLQTHEGYNTAYIQLWQDCLDRKSST